MPKAKFYGIENIIAAFEQEASTPYWAIWEGRVCHAQFRGEDMEDSINKLRLELDRIKSAGMDSIMELLPYPIKLHKGDYMYIKDKRYQVEYPIYFTVFEKNNNSIAGVPGNFYQAPGIDNRLNERLNTIESMLTVLADKNLEESDDEDEPDEIGKINQLLENDTVKGLIGALVGFLTRPRVPVVTNLAGIKINNMDPEYIRCLEILFAKGLTLEHLQKLANMSEQKIAMLLKLI